ncbi:eukaryotic translation elongation factor 1 epsilon-1 [Halyomorpha halys]|uniref:eukaryotic translation elongation factor 1 epsilon-1 n=1 Tax=Halyomorpha halys TaxID=286706 RepID=UPI0006D5285B|nr:eukaryotic translation elongation factor 1 epsilon-1-like [Halyomorpha halys]
MGSIRLKETNDDEADILSTQWMEYAHIYLKNITPPYRSQILSELNEALSFQSYLGGNQITTADKAVFRSLRHIMEQLTFQEKEKYLHLSRWCNIMQNEVESSRMIQFSRSLLY